MSSSPTTIAKKEIKQAASAGAYHRRRTARKHATAEVTDKHTKRHITTQLLTSPNTTRLISCIGRISRQHNRLPEAALQQLGNGRRLKISEDAKHAMADLTERLVERLIEESTELVSSSEISTGSKVLHRHVALAMIGVFPKISVAADYNAETDAYLESRTVDATAGQ